MIKYSGNTINDWNYGASNLIKVYRNGAVCYYKVTGGGDVPTAQTPCYAVVDDITQYQETEFEDVYDNATDKWYKLNNLNEYEEYGIYGTSTAETQSRLPQGYTEVEYIRNSNYNAYINTGVILFDNTSNTYTVTTRLTSEFNSNLGCATIIACENPISTYYGLGYRYKCSQTVDELEFYGSYPNYSATVVDNGDGTRDVTFQSTGDTTWTLNTPLIYFANWASTAYTSTNRPSDVTIYSATVVKNGVTVRDFVPAKRDSDDKYGLYDLITDTFYTSPNGNNFSGGQPVSNVTTYYQGKLAIVDDYEYQYSGSSWVNVGQVSGSSRLPQGYTEVEYVENTSTAYIDTGAYLNTSNFEVGYTFWGNKAQWGYVHQNVANGAWVTASNDYAYMGRFDSSYRVAIDSYLTSDENTIVYTQSGVTVNGSSISKTLNLSGTDNLNASTLLFFAWYDFYRARVEDSFNSKVKSFYLKNNGILVRDFVPAKRDSDNKYGMYDLVTNTFYLSPNNVDFSGGEPIAPTEYPKYYDEMQDPPDNLVFSTMAEAEAYECPWVGMHATIDGDSYIFSGDSQSGYEWVEIT